MSHPVPVRAPAEFREGGPGSAQKRHAARGIGGPLRARELDRAGDAHPHLHGHDRGHVPDRYHRHPGNDRRRGDHGVIAPLGDQRHAIAQRRDEPPGPDAGGDDGEVELLAPGSRRHRHAAVAARPDGGDVGPDESAAPGRKALDEARDQPVRVAAMGRVGQVDAPRQARGEMGIERGQFGGGERLHRPPRAAAQFERQPFRPPFGLGPKDVEQPPAVDQPLQPGIGQERQQQVERRRVEPAQGRRDPAHLGLAPAPREPQQPGQQAGKLVPAQVERAGRREQPARHARQNPRHGDRHHGAGREYPRIAERCLPPRRAALVEGHRMAVPLQEERAQGADDAGADDGDLACWHGTPLLH